MPISQRPQPWSPADATQSIREIARGKYIFDITGHCKRRLAERNLIISDLLYVLKNGFVYDDPVPSTQTGLYKYCIEYSTPNTNQRSLRVVVVPGLSPLELKAVSIMWVDE